MPIECTNCGHESSQVSYRRPPPDTNIVWILRVLLIASALFAVGGALSTAGLTMDLSDQLDGLRAWTADLAGTEYQGVHDGAVMASNAALLLALIALVGVLYILARYVILLWRVKTASPRVLWQVRLVAALSIGLWVAKWLSLSFILVDTPYYVALDGWDLGLLVATALLVYTYRAPVRAYFSTYRLAPLPPHPVPATPAPAPMTVAPPAGASVPAAASPACSSCNALLPGPVRFCPACGGATGHDAA